jgi:peptidoglycan/LPS O-acetylase OafA/YrhL
MNPDSMQTSLPTMASHPGPVPSGKSGYIPTLDGWRAIAILWVLQAHTQLWSWHGLSNRWLEHNGARGVDIFFALSGLLICTRLLREEERAGRISLASFYVRRLFRIQPAALTYLAVVSILMLVGRISTGWDGVAGAFFMVRSSFPLGGGTWETGHFWSLAVEEQFYLLLPGFLVLVRRGRLRILIALVLLLQFWRVIVVDHAALHGLAPVLTLRTDMAIDVILLGSGFALALQHRQLRAAAQAYLLPWVAFLYTVLVFLELGLHNSRANRLQLILCFPLLITATLLHPQSPFSAVLEWAPLRFLGRISYSLYLWQELFLNPVATPTPGSFRANQPLCWAATFACALASYYLIEKPIIRYGHRFAHRFDRPAVPSAAPAVA